jgi:hypothetical protein
MTIDFEKIRRLDGRSVLVKPAKPADPNAVGMRGTIRVREVSAPENVLRVEIVLGYPDRSDVNGQPPHEEIVALSQADVLRLLDTSVAETGAYGVALDEGGRTV